MNVIKHQLENGLTILLSPNSEIPRFYAEIVTRAGSKHDPATNTGLAHYLEHLLFKGTRQFGTLNYDLEKPMLDEIAKLYEKRSEENNDSYPVLFQISLSKSQDFLEFNGNHSYFNQEKEVLL